MPLVQAVTMETTVKTIQHEHALRAALGGNYSTPSGQSESRIQQDGGI